MTIDDYVFVYRDGPAHTGPFEPLVKAADGERTTVGGGFDYAANYQAWCRFYGRPLPAWTYFEPGSHGNTVALVLAGAAPKAPYYVLDIEDKGIARVDVSAAVAILEHRAPVYLSTWGLKSQADNNGIPYAGMGFAGVMPQVYYDYQRPGIARWATVFSVVYPTFAPADAADWATQVGADPCGIWRYGTTDLAAAAAAITTRRATLAGPTPPEGGTMPTLDDDVDRIRQLVAGGHLDDAIKRFFTIWRDEYGGQSIINHLASIDAKLSATTPAQ